MMLKKSDLHLILLPVLFSALVFGCSASGPEEEVKLTVNPDFFRIPDEGGRVQFSATVSGSLDKNVTWSLLSGPGEIDANGLYTSEDITAQISTATVQAVKNSNTSITGTGNAGLTQITSSLGEMLNPGVVEIAIGGMFVPAGQTIDLNFDDIPDLVSRNPSSNEVSLLGGNESNIFAERKIALASSPVAMVVGDFIVEGFTADLAVASGQQIDFIQANSASWESQLNIPISETIVLTGNRTPVSLAFGIFHDSFRNFPISDLMVGAATPTGHELIFFRQNRDLVGFNFEEFGTFPLAGKPIQMIPADFDQDGALDLAIVLENSKDLFILFGNDLGDFPSNRTISFPEIITFLAKGDFNGKKEENGVKDVFPDLVAAHADKVSILLGNGDGSFGPALQIALNARPGTITIEDFNVGENDDIAIALPDENELFVLYGDGLGKFPGDWRFSTGALSPISLISGFFTGFDAPQGFQSIELVYMGINTNGTSSPADQFFLLSNQNN